MAEDTEENFSEEAPNLTKDLEDSSNVATESGKPSFTLLKRSLSTEPENEDCNVHVVSRVRPLNPIEEKRKDEIVIQFPGDGAVWIDNQGKKKTFSFHGVFEPGCNQAQVFENSGMPHLLDMALAGYACTAFAFGQTGSGKTYTMTGPVIPEESKVTQERSLKDVNCYGLIQFSFAYLINAISNKQDTTYSIRASYLEIYNEQVQDLLNPSSFDIIQLRWSKSLGFYVENLYVREIESLDDLLSVLEDGMKNRAVAEHNVNEHSSRSHSILTVYMESEMISEGIPVTKHGKVSFVDLAGSEKVKDTGSVGETLIEATNINRSLLTLGNCISALSDPKKRTGHIPFRDSKLTKLLADGLGGSGVTLMIACVTPSSFNLSETLNTLRYAKRARKIKNKPVVRIDPREELILKLQREMKLLVQENRFLRNQLEFPQREKPKFPLPNTARGMQQRDYSEPEQVNFPPIKPSSTQPGDLYTSPNDRSVSDNSLYGMLQEYMVENEALRNENQNLLTQHSQDEKEHKFVALENDKLVRKLEDLSRLMMSSPSYGSAVFFSRTNSGRSLQSFQTFSDSLTPISQKGLIYNPNNRQIMKPTNGYSPFEAKPMNGPVVAWNSTPLSHKHPNGLPPLRVSPHPNHKEPVIRKTNQTGHPVGSPPSKWVKATSYETQFKRKQKTTRPPPKPVKRQPVSQNTQKDVMKDFPMRDYEPARQNFNPHYSISSVGYSEDEENGHASSLRDTSSVNRLPTDFHVRFGKPGYFHVQNTNPAGGILPQDAYKLQDISPRGTVTKELSATSLRKLNNRMRQEMQALDDEIKSYQVAMNKQTKKKVPVT